MGKTIIRCNHAGVFYGIVKNIESTPSGNIVTIQDCRCLWYWEGAASLFQLALEGTKKPMGCKFTVTIPQMKVMDAIELIPCTEDAEKSIDSVPVWKI